MGTELIGSVKRSTTARGVMGELRAYLRLLELGLDVYQSVADDRGIDCIVRSHVGDTIVYFDIQVKSAGVRGKFAGLTRENIEKQSENFLCLFVRADGEAQRFFYLSRCQLLDLGFKSDGGNPALLRKQERVLYLTQGIDVLASRIKDGTYSDFHSGADEAIPLG